MFERQYHRLIAEVLDHLDADKLLAHHCYFAGGTAIVLRYGEYRESRDMDFMVSDLVQYRSLCRLLGSSKGLRPVLADWPTLEQARDVRADQYGIRTWLTLAGAAVKFEIIFEARIDLDPPGEKDRICGIATLTGHDMAATKLLANSDRWADDGVFSRDLIDLAMIELRPEQWNAALETAESAYGDAILRDLRKALQRIKSREGWLDRCCQALSIKLPKALIWDRLRELEKRYGS